MVDPLLVWVVAATDEIGEVTGSASVHHRHDRRNENLRHHHFVTSMVTSTFRPTIRVCALEQ
jgi:hypothetical protein